MTVKKIIHLPKHLLMLIILCSLTFGKTEKIRKDLKVHKNWKLLYRDGDCGQSVSDRIIGGTEASLRKYPWMARLKYTIKKADNRSMDVFECGGAIISPRYILTAAHCSPEYLGISLKTVILGEHRVSSDIDCQNGMCAEPVQELEVETYVCHEYYNNDNYHNDICLIRTGKPIVFNNFVHPICLPSYDFFTSQKFAHSQMEVAGWGVNNIITENTSDILEFAILPIVPLYDCNNFYGWQAEITEKQLCAGGIIGVDSCTGDSGGPLMKVFSTDSPPRYFIVGIVSYGPTDCGETLIPGIYTRVDKYMTWILDHVRE